MLISYKVFPMHFITCEDIISVKLHVHLVLLRYVSHDPLGAAVLLSGQQPTQWLREDPNKEDRGVFLLIRGEKLVKTKLILLLKGWLKSLLIRVSSANSCVSFQHITSEKQKIKLQG